MPDSPAVHQRLHEDALCAAAVPLCEIRSGGFPIYAQALFDALLSDPEHACNPNLACHEDFKRLLTHEALTSFEEIWRRSAWFSDHACELAGIDCGRDLQPLTATLLGEMARSALKLPDMLAAKMTLERFIIEQRRIVEAGIRYGFLVKMDLRANYKPVEGTEKLHRLMLEVYARYRDLVVARAGLDDHSNDDSVTQAGK